MNRGGNISPAAGFTLLETMIVLIVTSVLLVSAILAMSGRQAKTDFQVGREAVVRDFQNLFSKIESGRYDSTNNFTCSRDDVGWVGGVPRFDTNTSTPKGTNAQCIFLGQALLLGNNDRQYSQYLLAGSREAYGAGADVTTHEGPEGSHPQVLSNSEVVQNFPNNLRYAGSRYVAEDGTMTAVSMPTTQVAARILLDLKGADVLSGQRAGSLAATVHKTAWNFDINFTVNGATPIEDPQRALLICLASGGTNQSIILSLGNNKGKKVTSTVVNGRTCAWY